MKRLLITAAAAVALFITACSDQPVPTGPAAAPGGGAPAVTAPADDFVPGRVLARFHPGAPAASIAAAQGGSVQREVTLGILMLQVPAGAELRVVEALSRNPNVEFAEPDYIRTFGNPSVMPVNDPFIGYKWDLDNDGFIYSGTGEVLAATGSAGADMDWREAYEHLNGSVSGSAIVGIMDTGIRADHEDLTGRLHAQHDFFAGDSNAADDNGHGTHVAGIVAAAANNGSGVAGVAFGDIRFAIAKVCGPTGRGPFNSYGCPLSAIAEGITWAVDNGANVLNLSLGGSSGSSAEQSALQYARANNVLPFCASGNDNGSVSYPAAFPECVAVGATDWGDNRASYSNFGPQVELSAPGGDNENSNGYSYILSAYHDSPTAYAFMAGTSMASPQAAGLAALLHALGTGGANDKLQRMTETADDLGPAGRDNQFGHGRINVFRAVSDGGDPPPPDENQPPTATFTFGCTDLACDFDASASSDSDGSIASYAWTFGDGGTASGVAPSHTYAGDGTYSVTLTVTDDEGASDSQTQSVTVSASSGGDEISLSASGYKVRGVQHADLSWSGATGSQVDIYRNGSRITTTANDGAHTDNIGSRGGGSYTYQVCEAGTATCSSQVSVTF